MKVTVTIILALLAGLVLGSWSVKDDLRRARKEVADLKQQLSQRPAARHGSLDGITSMLKIPDRTAHGRTKPPVSAGPAPEIHLGPTPEETGSNAVWITLGDSGTNAPRRHRQKPDREGLRKQLETAADAWKVRSDLARAGFVSNVATADDQTIQFDVAMAAMNVRLSNSVRTWVDYVKQQQDVTPETGIRIMNDLSGSMVQAYTDLDRAMPADWRDKAGSKFQVFDFINPETIMPLTEVEDVFRRTDNAAGTNGVVDRAP